MQVFTSPLHTLALSVFYAFTRDPSGAANPTRIYFTAMAFSYAVSLLTILWLTLRLKERSANWAVFALLMSSQAFVPFTSSGLEAPLIYLFVVLFYLDFFQRVPTTQREYFWLLLWPSLSVVTRLDTALLFLPASLFVVVMGYRTCGWKILRPVIVASIPMFLWFGFALFYFGSLLPNSYYAKVASLSVDTSILHDMGSAYLLINAIQDPITLAVISCGIFLAAFDRKAVFAGVSCLLYVGYIYHVGGDFIGYRFLAPPFLISVLVIGQFLQQRRHWNSSLWSLSIVVTCVGYGLMVQSSPLRAYGGGSSSRGGGNYFEASNLANWRPGKSFPFSPFHLVGDERQCEALRGEKPSAIVKGGGLASFCAGPTHHRIFAAGLADPLLARLVLKVDRDFLPGHLPRPLPEGYLSSIAQGKNVLKDRKLALYYDGIRSLAVSPLLSEGRIRNILEFNFTSKRTYSDPYVQADPPYGPGAARRKKSLVERLSSIRRERNAE